MKKIPFDILTGITLHYQVNLDNWNLENMEATYQTAMFSSSLFYLVIGIFKNSS